MTGLAQQISLIRPGLLRAYATLSPRTYWVHSYDDSPYYLHSNLEYYVNRRISLVGETYYDLEAVKKDKLRFSGWFPVYSPIQYYLSTFLGGNYHWAGKKGDVFAGIQPGIGFIRLNPLYYSDQVVRLGVNPLASLSVGYNFYFFPLFHFFVQGRFIVGRHITGYPINLTELRFSGGLGFNLNTRKQR